MKYCKRCFRNIDDKYTACPHCNQSDKLILYSSDDSGEKFECVRETHNSFKEKATYKTEKKDSYHIEDNNPYDDLDFNIHKEKSERVQLKSELSEELENMTPEQRQAHIRKLVEARKRELDMQPASYESTNNSVTYALDTFPEEQKTLIMPVWGKIIYAIFTSFNPAFAIIAYTITSKIFKDDIGMKTLGIFMIILSFIFVFGMGIAGSLI